MSLPRPSLTLIMDIDERVDTKELRLEINRCFTHVGSTLVRTHPAPEDGSEPVNVARMLMKMGTSKYLRSADEGADELWDAVVERWLRNEFYKIGNSLMIFNRRQREIDNPEMPVTWIQIDLQNGELPVMVHCDTVSGIDPDASQAVTALRTAYNEGKLGEADNVAKVWMPTLDSWDQQAEAGLIAREQREAEKEAERQAAEAAAEAERQAAEAEADKAFLESPELLADQEVATGEGQEPTAEADHLAEGGGVEDVEEMYALDEPDFAVDYRLWTVEYTDGSTRTYDSETGELA